MIDDVLTAVAKPEQRPLPEVAYENLLSRIIRLELPPGSALVEKALTDELQLGRTPIREALQRLTVEGLVCREHYRGVYVCEVTADSIERVAEFRKMTDPQIAQFAAERATSEESDFLLTRIELMNSAVKSLEFDSYVNSSRDFYTGLAQCTHNLHFEESAKRIFNFDARLLYLAAGCDTGWIDMANARIENALTVADCVKRHASEEASASVRLFLTRYFTRVIDKLDNYLVSGGLGSKPKRQASG
ncbi:MAG: GntR family transcriptional regulator [Paracoccaceae bacterium]|nr:GntR family transcriptional regulator [Paracoccaceae bacterium]